MVISKLDTSILKQSNAAAVALDFEAFRPSEVVAFSDREEP
jgi:hypothetical protein